MKASLKVLAAAVIMLGVASQAHATAINVSPSTTACGTPTCLLASGPETSQDDIDTVLAALLGPSVTELYKQNVGEGTDSGAFAPYYQTAFQNTPTDPSGFTITWVGSGSNYISTVPVYLLVKDGNQDPAWYLFDISNWGGQDLITGTNFWPNQGAVSHIALYGGATTTVPDGGSMVTLLGMALLGVAGLRRMIS